MRYAARSAARVLVAPRSRRAPAERLRGSGRLWRRSRRQKLNRARFYQPSIGRFIQEDPVRNATGAFSYVSSSPVRYRDPRGLFKTGDVVCRRRPGQERSSSDVVVVLRDPGGDSNRTLGPNVEIASFGRSNVPGMCGTIYTGPAGGQTDPYQGFSEAEGSGASVVARLPFESPESLEKRIRDRAREWFHCYQQGDGFHQCADFVDFLRYGFEMPELLRSDVTSYCGR